MVLVGQYAGRHGSSNPGNSQGGSTAPADNPDLTDFKHAVAVEATDAQVTQFKALAKCTNVARQMAQILRQSGSESAVQQATALQFAVDEVQRQDRDFLKTFSDAQASGLKRQTKKLNQSDATVTKEARKLAAHLDQIPPDPQRLQEAATSMEQALATLQSDQTGLSKEMGMEAH